MLVRHFLLEMGASRLAFPTEVVIRECLNNAVLHGNCEDPNKRMTLTVRADKGSIHIRVSDEGAGFDWKQYGMGRVPASTAMNGRGLTIVHSLAKEVTFNRRGNEINVEISKQHVKGVKK